MLKPGTVIGGKYRLRHLVAEGGMAEVYLAESINQNNELYALKRLLPSLCKDPIFRDLFAFEASLTSSFKHPNIAACYEFLRDGDEVYMVMEFIFGKEISSLIKGLGDLPLMERIKIAVVTGISICKALNYIHRKCDLFGARIGIVHADISPQNIMVTMDGDIKLYDFGAAQTETFGFKINDDLVRGNLRYMSPEQMAGHKIDALSDVFSLSLVLFEIISGKPVRHHNKNRIMLDIAAPLFINHQIEHLFEAGLSIDKDRRFSSQEMLTKLEELAKILNIVDARQLLVSVVAKIGNSSKKPLRRKINQKESLASWLYVSATAISVGFLIFATVFLCSDVFEPLHVHRLPFWPSTTEEMIEPLHQSEKNTEHEKSLLNTQVTREYGTLLLVVRPWAEVFIDGEFFGATPMGGLKLPAGQYLIKLSNPDIPAVALRMVKIYPDKKTELIHSFNRRKR